MKKTPLQIHAGLLCDVYINRNQLLKEIIFHIDYTWELIVCQTKVNLSRLKIDVSPLYTVPDFWENLLHDLNRIAAGKDLAIDLPISVFVQAPPSSQKTEYK
jgi:hypothetical protein